MTETVEIRNNFVAPTVYPWMDLKVGAAFTTNDLTKYQTLRSAATRQGRRLKRKFSVKKIKEKSKATGELVALIAVVRVK